MESKDGTWIMYGVSEVAVSLKKEEVGFLPLFRNEIPGFSVEERTTEKYWWSEDPQRDPWVWREIIARRGDIAYGKFFHNKAGFISKKWFPYFANYRRAGYDFDARWDDELASFRQSMVILTRKPRFRFRRTHIFNISAGILAMMMKSCPLTRL